MDHSQNKATMESLYDEYADDIFRFVVLRVRDRERAQDMVQDVFMRMWNTYIKEGMRPEQPRALLYTIARNLVINSYERDKVHDSLDTLLEAGIEMEDADMDTARDAKNTDLHKMLATLSDEEKELVSLRHLEGLSVKEIASMFSLSENVTSVKIHRALEKLTNRFGETTNHEK